MSEEVADLYASLGLRTDTSSFSKGGAALDGVANKARIGEDRASRWYDANKRSMSMQAQGAIGLGNTIKDAGDKAYNAGEQFAGVWKLALMAAAYTGIQKAEHALIGFNQQVEDSKISLSAMISGMTGAEWGKATSQADALYNEFQKFSTTTPVTTQQILQFGKGIAAATFAAGGGVEELKNLTEQGVIAAKVLAPDRGAGYAELEITELLSGVINRRMVLARQLLSMGHVSEEAWKSLDGKGRIKALQKIFNSDSMNNARDAFGTSFSGVTSTAWDKIQIALGKVGLPLFTAITEKVKELNAWMTTNSATIERFAARVGQDLARAFEIASAAFEFVTEHATFFEGILIGLGAMIAGFAVTAAIDWAIAFWPITLAIASIAALHSAINWLFGDIDDETDKAASTMGGFSDAIGHAAAGNFDQLNGGLDDVTARAHKAAAAVSSIAGATAGLGLKDAQGNPIDDAWFKAHGDGGLGAAAGPSLAAPTLPADVQRDNAIRSLSGAAAPPVVNVNVTGNMPEGWIDAKVDGKIQDHHQATWNNAANALQADTEE